MRCVIKEAKGTFPHPISHITHPKMLNPLCWLVAALIFTAFAVNPGKAWALFGDTESAFGFDGRFSTLPALQDNYDFDPFFGDDDTDLFWQTLLRLIAAGRPSEQISYDVQAVQSFDYSSAGVESESPIFRSGSAETRYRAMDANWDWHEGDKTSATLWLDRANAKLALAKADITIGRQAITFGKAYFWNPLDVFLAFDPRQFDRDYKAGVDAIRADVSWSPFSGVNLVAVAGRQLDGSGEFVDDGSFVNASWYGSALMAHAFTTYEGWDFALQTGKIYGGYQLGGGLVGEIGPVETRVEAAYFWAQDDSEPLPDPQQGDLVEDNFTAVVGLGHRFDNTLTLQFEYFYNGAGDPDDLNGSFFRFASGNILQISRNLTGFLVSYEFQPILIGQVIWLHSWDDASNNIQPILTWSATDNMDLLVGANLNFGERPEGTSVLDFQIESEYGTFPNLYFMQFKWYF
ncbi:MAG: hypothetical protein PVH57_08960 [Syntrophobacterales bacterium]